MEKNIVEHILEIKDLLPKKQRQLCNYLVLHAVEAHMMTVAQLADESGVGPTTVMRLLKTLGYDSFGDFKRDLFEAALVHNTSSYKGIKQSFQMSGRTGDSHALTAAWSDGMRTIENFITPENMRQFDRAIDLMLEAERINLLGMRLSVSAALYFESMVERFLPRTRQLSNQQEYIYDKVVRMGQGDILVAFSVWPCTRKTVEIAGLCHEKGIPVILVTNTSLNPIARFAEVVIDTNSVGSSCGILPTMAVVEAMIAELGKRTSPGSTETLEQLEEMLDRQNVFIWEQNL